MVVRIVATILLGVFVLGVAAPAWASCGASSCPVDCTNWERRKKGDILLEYQSEYSEQDQLRIGTRDAAFREIRGHHDEEYTVNRIQRFSATVSLTDRLALQAKVPYVSRSHSHIHRHQGRDILDQWDIGGFGDLALIGKYTFYQPENLKNPTLTLHLGVELPTGQHDQPNASGDIAEAGVQPGSNSTDFIVGLSSIQTFEAPMLNGQKGTMPFYTSFNAQLNGSGTDDYRLGDTFQFNIGATYPLHKKVGLITQFNFLLRDRDGKGRTGEEIQKTGGEVIYFSPGLEYRINDDWKVYGVVQLPVYERVNLIQTVADYNVVFGMSYRFNILDLHEKHKARSKEGIK